MQHRKAAFTDSQMTMMLGMFALLLVVFIILFPDKAFQASLQGLNLWWKLVFPALLPFFILLELMMGIGVIHAAGKLLEPLMSRLFGLPGASGWALALGWTAGAPAGAAAIGKLNQTGLLSQDEANKLLSISFVCSPVFIITVVGVSYLQSAQLGLALAIIHYASAMLLGALLILLTRNNSKSKPNTSDPEASKLRTKDWYEHPDKSAGLFARSLYALHKAHEEDGRTFGKLLGDSVTTAVQNLLVIGGYIMMFSVLFNVISLSGLLEWLGRTTASAGGPGQHLYQWLLYLLPSMLEVHLGSYSISQSDMAPFAVQAAILSAALAWGGVSAQLQAKSLCGGTSSLGLFLKWRVIHTLIAFVLCLLVWKPLTQALAGTEPSFLSLEGSAHAGASGYGLWLLVTPMMLQFAAIMLGLLVVSISLAFVRRLRSS
jgi:sporulation integral membrane protein YlbJ